MHFKKSFYRGLYDSLVWWQLDADIVWQPHPEDGLVADANMVFYREHGGEKKTKIYSVEIKLRLVENGICITDAASLAEQIEKSVSSNGGEFWDEDKSILLQVTTSLIKLIKETLSYAKPVINDIIGYYSMVMS